MSVLGGSAGRFGRFLDLFKTIGFCDDFASPWRGPSPCESLGGSLGTCRAPRGPSGHLQRSFRTAFGCHWAQRVLFGDRLVWHARSWASAVDFEAASRRCLLRRYVQIQLKPMVFQYFHCAPGSCWDVSNVFLGCCLAPQIGPWALRGRPGHTQGLPGEVPRRAQRPLRRAGGRSLCVIGGPWRLRRTFW